MDSWFARWLAKSLGLWVLMLTSAVFVMKELGASDDVIGAVGFSLFVVMLFVALHLYDRDKARHQFREGKTKTAVPRAASG